MVESKEQKAPLLPRIAQGDSEAVQDFISRYKGLLWWLTRQMAAERDAEDAVQEIFVDLWSNAGRYDPSRSSEAAFVAMVGRRRLIDRQRKFGRRPLETSLDALEVDLPGFGTSSVEAVAEASLAGDAIRELDAKERQVLAMSVYHGFSHSEIAHHTRLPLGTVKTYVRRGLSRVREALAPKLRASEVDSP
jgi:RNA polymerase sigma factor (sigma-70 family)